MRCYFNLVSAHESILDHDGVEVSDLDQARSMARAAAQEIVQTGEARVGDWQGWRMKVVNGSGVALFSFDLEELFARAHLAFQGCEPAQHHQNMRTNARIRLVRS